MRHNNCALWQNLTLATLDSAVHIKFCTLDMLAKRLITNRRK